MSDASHTLVTHDDAPVVPAHYSEEQSSFRRRAAGWLADSFLMRRGRRLFEKNTADFLMPLSKVDKLLTGGYIILKDYSTGRFPPTFEDQAKTYLAEMSYFEATPGVSVSQHVEAHGRKPLWGHKFFEHATTDFTLLLRTLEGLAIPQNGSVLELGCGGGWMAEFLALAGYNVVGTSIAPSEVGVAQARANAFRGRGMPNTLRYETAAMETVDKTVGENGFDVVFTYEALHHAFDWRAAIAAARRCLKPGGWIILANEPNLLHTYISYRVARMVNLHDIGMSRRQLVGELSHQAFGNVRALKPRVNNWVSPHWIAAQK